MRKALRDAMLAEVNAAKAIADTAIREERDLTDVEQGAVDTHMGKASAISASWEKEKAFQAQFKTLTAGLGPDHPDDDGKPKPPVPGSPESAKHRLVSPGKAFTSSAEYKALLSGVPNGYFGEKARVQSNPMPIGGMKALFYSGDREASAGFLVEDDRRGLLDPFYQRPLTVRSLFSSGGTTSDTIDYVRMTTVDNNAAVVAEATSADVIDGTTVTDAIGGLKPQSGFEFDRDSTTVKTIAHWIPITKRALSDAAQIRTMIDSFLRYGLEEAFEDELINGVGTGEHFLGLLNTPGIQTQAAPAGAQTNLDTLRMARRKVRIGGRTAPTAYVMNPVDWEKIDLMKDTTNRYLGAGPFAMGPQRLWGLPVIESEAVAVGTAWCANWNWGVIYDREQASVQATDSHSDFFVRNLVAILAEMRAAFAVLRPAAFVKVTVS